jgi:signal transduction histidine kinase
MLLLAAYLLLVALAAVWMERELRLRAASMLAQTERLLGREVAATLTGPAVQQIVEGDPVALARLRETVEQVTQRSQMVTSIVVVDASGRVIAGEGADKGRQLTIPQLVFEHAEPSRLEKSTMPEESFLYAPLRDQDQLIGYLRLTLRNEPIAQLYGLVRRQLVVAGGVGLLLAALLGMLLHLQFSRLGGTLARSIESAARGETLAPSGDEFSEAFSAAQRMGVELRAARDRSTQATDRLRSVTEILDVGVLLVRPDGNLEFGSPRAVELLGCRDNDALERQWLGLRAPLLEKLQSNGASAKSSLVVDIEVSSGDHPNRLRLEAHRASTDPSDPLLVFVKDRDGLEALERELRLAVQMRGFARFYMAFAHDLKAPLNAMALNLELLNLSLRREGDDEPKITDQQRRYIEVVKSEIFRLDRDLRTLLHQVAPPSETSADFDLRDVIADLMTLLEPQAKKQHVQLETRLPEAAVPLSGHRDRIKQAMLNIAINALEAMPKGGQLTIALDQTAGEARVCVQDTGPGISPDILQRIYDMNFTTKEAGSGIGLYVARSVVESHGGEIHVASAAGQGTRFELELPIVHATA